MIKGILFDFDGTLAKTMEDHYLAWRESFRSIGILITEEEYYPLEGMSILEIATLFCKKYNVDGKHIPTIISHKKEYYMSHNSRTLYLRVPEIISTLKARGFLLGLVTASVLEQLQSTVSQQFLEKFDAIITGDKTSRGKPFPDPYLKALQELQLSSEECIAVENAPLGIRSAKSAEIYCIAVMQTVGREKLQEANEIVPAIQDIINTQKLSL